MATRRGRDYWVLYDSDLGVTRYAVQRTYSFPPQGQTPLTPLFFARLVSLPLPPGLVKLSWNPRKYIACLPNPANVSGESNLSVICPYHPSSPNVRLHGIEIKNYPGVHAVSYQGEQWLKP